MDSQHMKQVESQVIELGSRTRLCLIAINLISWIPTANWKRQGVKITSEFLYIQHYHSTWHSVLKMVVVTFIITDND
jgi:hypothetical protein